MALLAMLAIPEVAHAAGPGVSPSLKNLLLSVGGGAVVLSAIAIGIAGVSTFDPVKRGGRYASNPPVWNRHRDLAHCLPH
jgi:hypothetical protein